MGAANGFFRLEPATVNGGFSNEINYLNDVLALAKTDVDTLGSFVGMYFQTALNLIKPIVATYAASPYFAGFELKYPSPFPSISGVQTVEFSIRNPQQFATIGNRILISLDLSGGYVTAQTITLANVDSDAGNYSDPLLAVEKDVIRALEIREQLGAALFPDYYQFASGIAVSGLARAQNWEYSDNLGYPVRNPLPTLPYEPAQSFTLDYLDKNQKYILTLLGKIVQYSFTTGIVQLDLINYASALSLPTDWVLVVETNGSNLVEFTIKTTGFAFKLVGEFTYFWLWQRWVSPETGTTNVFIDNFSAPLPFEPNSGKLYFTTWYDLEFVCFSENCNTVPQVYGLPAKSGDEFRFNVLPEFGNFAEMTSVLVGIVDQDFVFIQQIGTAQMPECGANLVYTVTIEGSFIGALLVIIALNSADTFIRAVDADDIATTIITVPFASTNTGSATLYAQSIIDYINGLPGYSATFTYGTDIVFSITIEGLPTGAVSLQLEADGDSTIFDGDAVTSCCATQLQATVTIPAISNGCYRIILYNIDSGLYETYSVSNLIIVNEEDCFSQMLEFAGDDNTINEGFEYFDNWIQRIRIGLQAGAPTPVINESIYRKSNGVSVRPSKKSDLKLSLQTNYIDKPTQKAVFGATRHPLFVLAGQSLFVTGDVNVSHNKDFSTEDSYFELSLMDFEALIQGFQPDNNGCIAC